MMKQKNIKNKTFLKVTLIGIIVDIIEIATIMLGITTGTWIPFTVGLPFVIVITFMGVKIYYDHTTYICTHCNKKFKPKWKEFIFANHTSKTRKLTCTQCGVKDWCIETYMNK